MEKNINTSNRKFGLLMGAVFLLVTIYYGIMKHEFLPVLLAVSAFFVCAALLMPRILYPLNWGWTKFSAILGMLNTWIILTLLYVVIITPLGLLMKALGKDALKLKLQKKTTTYWVKAAAVEGSSVKQQF
ncbi:SxtJ family membrane protein [Pedobacter hartonius]|uniref:SxtJ n=1 Tax=Pedobacter hartonius TaxID=425514 RepID=A0A1H3XFL4_9SPHI|nr:SxtJ family membrane protein [Pedobacter hartonius]SDZ98149.1 hypothetical protein SAMN05443550_101600 [Pedobacter hartonius]